MVFQGDIEAVAQKSPKDLTQLFEQLSGSDELKQAYNDAQLKVKEAEEENALPGYSEVVEGASVALQPPPSSALYRAPLAGRQPTNSGGFSQTGQESLPWQEDTEWRASPPPGPTAQRAAELPTGG